MDADRPAVADHDLLGDVEPQAEAPRRLVAVVVAPIERLAAPRHGLLRDRSALVVTGEQHGLGSLVSNRDLDRSARAAVADGVLDELRHGPQESALVPASLAGAPGLELEPPIVMSR